jgi:hypothetical protein
MLADGLLERFRSGGGQLGVGRGPGIATAMMIWYRVASPGTTRRLACLPPTADATDGAPRSATSGRLVPIDTPMPRPSSGSLSGPK